MSLMDIQQLSSFIAQSKRTIMHIQLKILREGEYSLTDIAPLYECHEIRSLDLGVGGQLVNTADLQFQRMAQAWPHLRELSVVTEAWRDDAWTVTFEGGELTPVSLDVLHPFALHCPELSEVRITGIGAPPTTYPVLPLQAGVVQASMIHFKLDDLSNDVAKAADVARLLDGLYPDREIRFLGDSRYATRVRKALHKHRRLRLELENAQELE
ncbi:hypothetical protein CALCODRAFT_510230 [Calocera cornea HHB12733]|uniref:F-box domain-containing protein n=1 Tax=Calocera cornea HHB12733 TaxID=1353952 RepID=A0A165EP76_9BASI|nr:hypothetical protein CALCODRAFT_510230 [Calocera cornea HHB12733]